MVVVGGGIVVVVEVVVVVADEGASLCDRRARLPTTVDGGTVVAGTVVVVDVPVTDPTALNPVRGAAKRVTDLVGESPATYTLTLDEPVTRGPVTLAPRVIWVRSW